MTLATDRAQLARELAPKGGAAFSAAWRARVEPWLIERFALARSEAGLGDVDAPGLALVAVGGTGRGDLAPESDLDLLLLHDKKIDPREVAERLWYPIWDEGLKLGHAVRTGKDALTLASGDLETATSLLACRHLVGDATLTDALADDALTLWRKKSKWALGALRETTKERWAGYGELAFLLEPDLKESHGGLRDIHGLRWAELAGPVLDADDAQDLASCEEALFDVRVALHTVTGRATERLGLEDQDAVAEVLGMDADELMASLSAGARRVAWVADEAWVRVSTRLSSDRPLLGWRSRSRAPGVIVRAGQVQLEPSADPAAPTRRCCLDRGRRRDPHVVPSEPGHVDAPRRAHADAARTVVDGAAGPVRRRARRGHGAIPVIESLDHVDPGGPATCPSGRRAQPTATQRLPPPLHRRSSPVRGRGQRRGAGRPGGPARPVGPGCVAARHRQGPSRRPLGGRGRTGRAASGRGWVSTRSTGRVPRDPGAPPPALQPTSRLRRLT